MYIHTVWLTTDTSCTRWLRCGTVRIHAQVKTVSSKVGPPTAAAEVYESASFPARFSGGKTWRPRVFTSDATRPATREQERSCRQWKGCSHTARTHARARSRIININIYIYVCVCVCLLISLSHTTVYFTLFSSYSSPLSLSPATPPLPGVRVKIRHIPVISIYIYNNNMMLTKLSVYAHISYTYALD